MAPILRLLRPRHAIKNLFVFVPMLFSFRIFDRSAAVASLAAFLAFTLTASGVYAFNDCHDVEEDRRHPVKRSRPVASGQVSRAGALALACALFAAGIGLGWAVRPALSAVLGIYVLLNLSYTIWFKHLALLDISVIGLCFILRLVAGSAATGIPLSLRVLLTTFSLSLFLALGKRRDDVRLWESTGERPRRAVDGYNLKFIDAAIVITATMSLVCYVLYVSSPEQASRFHSPALLLSAIPVIIGVLRYLQLAFVQQATGSPTDLVTQDAFLLCTIGAWALLILLLVWQAPKPGAIGPIPGQLCI